MSVTRHPKYKRDHPHVHYTILTFYNSIPLPAKLLVKVFREVKSLFFHKSFDTTISIYLFESIVNTVASFFSLSLNKD